ncbi:DUF305 domain-containing protein [Paenibacillus sp. TRM 82003]|uniref:DUF305 domain-containing protein n=1 Tax=Kineococcus sp. TRM81007 TaxID=2925831 RepID=UPI001F58B7A3|nr:DUF305 domain-containing protein [Kineococcus sp. TRM81007]MCI2239223.1 DUF305 domain-containing protein [Kineococcus sp. TRM81007]MCI3924904.1 DUF305 domain-containing protein [Paenibacillus sp. TRM 82003]
MKRLTPAALLCATALLAGCTVAESDVPEPTAPVVLPQGPGEPAATTTAVPPAEDPAPAEADVEFAVMMVPHHRQAVQMAELAPQRARDEAVRTLATRIAQGQGAEIDVLTSWLDDRGGVAWAAAQQDHHGGHDTADMPGAVTTEQLQELADARGAGFDELFLDLMIDHHEGALAMAGDALRSGTDVRMQELATDVAVTQEVEVRRMRELLERVAG